MKVTKTAIYRITAATGCGCTVQREYEDAEYKKPLGENHTFNVCAKHKDQPGVDVIEMILGELVEKEAAEHKPAEAAPAARPNASATVGPDGELIMRVPIQQRQQQRVTNVQASGSRTAAAAAAPRPARPASPSQAARTGPAKTYIRPTAPAAKSAATADLATAGVEDEEDDLFAQNDPEKAY